MRSPVVPRLPPEPPPRGTFKVTRKTLLLLLLGAAIGVVLGFAGAKGLPQMLVPVGEGRRSLKLLVLALLPVVWVTVIATHELGHLVAGRLTGGQFILFGVGPVIVKRTPVGLRLTWNHRLLLSGGLVVCMPRGGANLSQRLALMIAGGPLASLLLTVGAGALSVWLARAAGPAPAAELFVAQHVATFVAALSAFVTLVAGVPAVAAGFKTDGRRLWDLIRPGPHREQEAALLLVAGASLAGVRPRDYPPASLDALLSLNDHSVFDLQAHIYAYRHAADRGEWLRAQQHLDHVMQAEALLPAFLRESVRADYAWLLATQTTDVAAARAWLESAGTVSLHPATRWRAEAAVRRAEGNALAAREAARAAIRWLEQHAIGPVPDRWELEVTAALLDAPVAETP